MAHEIEQFEDGSAGFVSAREPAWHRLGKVVADAMTATEVLNQALLSKWDVRHSQLYIMAEGEPQPVKERFATVRTNPVTGGTDTLGIVSDHYQVFQNEDLASVIDTVADTAGAHFETAGSLRGGKRVFVNMKLPQGFTVAGLDTEQHDLYLLGTTTHDGRGKIQFITTPVRVVCQNTLTAGLSQLVTSFGIRHKGNLQPKIQEVRDALELQHKAVDDFQVEAERMLNEPMSDDGFVAFAEKLWAPAETATAQRRRDKLNWLWHEAATLDTIRGTRWGAWQAVTEYVDHYDAPSSSPENRAKRAVDGAGQTRKEKAYQLLVV